VAQASGAAYQSLERHVEDELVAVHNQTTDDALIDIGLDDDRAAGRLARHNVLDQRHLARRQRLFDRGMNERTNESIIINMIIKVARSIFRRTGREQGRAGQYLGRDDGEVLLVEQLARSSLKVLDDAAEVVRVAERAQLVCASTSYAHGRERDATWQRGTLHRRCSDAGVPRKTLVMSETSSCSSGTRWNMARNS